MIYREVAPSYEAKPPYQYECQICERLIQAPHFIKMWAADEGYTIPGHRAVDVLHNGKTITVHETCNRQ